VTAKGPPLTELAVKDIKVVEQVRRDFGDIRELADSIAARGLLHPLVVTAGHRLVCGERRLRALRLLGRPTAPVHVVDNLTDALAVLLAQRDENTCRKPYTPGEAVEVARQLEGLERERAKNRQRQHGGTAPGKKKNTPGNLPQVTGTTRDRVAEFVGLGARTLGKAMFVVDAAQKEPALQPVVEDMNATGKVDGPYRRAVQFLAEQARQEAAAPLPDLDLREDLARQSDLAHRLAEALEAGGGFNAAAAVTALGREGALKLASRLGRLGRLGAALFAAAQPPPGGHHD
jgi:ParB-like chromosome segregation protein Spo0J